MFNIDSNAVPTANYLNEMDYRVVAKRLNLERFTKFGIFVGFLCFISFLHGVINNYFRGTSHIWSLHYGYSKQTVDWIIYANEIFAGIFALCVAYWGNRMHRVTWIGTLNIFLSISCITLALPEIYNPFTAVETNSAITGPLLCERNITAHPEIDNLPKKIDKVHLIIFIFFQASLAMAQTAFITLGLSYTDDHISPKHSPVLIGLVTAAGEIGKQIGIYCSWTVYISSINEIFLSPVWLTIASLAFLSGILMTVFPKTFPHILMMKYMDPLEENNSVDAFFETVWRVLKNKTLLFNIFSFVLIQSALINFRLLEKYFNQSKYHMSMEEDTSGYTEPDLIQFTSNMLVQPLFAIFLVISGIIISKARPRAKHLIIWNILTFMLMAIIFASSVFWTCTKGIQNELEHVISVPFCSSMCACTVGEPFQPVCVNGKTYFSPCLAGCTNFTPATNLFHDCSCGTPVIEGSCDDDSCRISRAIGQALGILSNVLLATTLVSHIVINIRSVFEKDKSMALGLALMNLQLISYVPVRFIYLNIVDFFCEIKSGQSCQYFSEHFPMFLSIITIVMIILAVTLSTILLFFLNDIQLFTAKRYDSSADFEVNPRITEMRAPRDPTYPSASNETIKNLSTNEESPCIRQQIGRVAHRHNVQHDGSEKMDDEVNNEVGIVPPLPPPKKPSSKSSSRKNSKTSNKSSDVSISTSLEEIADQLGDPGSDSDSTLCPPEQNKMENTSNETDSKEIVIPNSFSIFRKSKFTKVCETEL